MDYKQRKFMSIYKERIWRSMYKRLSPPGIKSDTAKCTMQADRRGPTGLTASGPTDRTTLESTSCPSLAGLTNQNRYAALRNLDEENKEIEKPKLTCCAAGKVLRRKARMIVKLLKLDQGLKPLRKVPSLNCINFRNAIRSIYPPDLSLAQELSIKTCQKVVLQCQFCKEQKDDISEWKEGRKKTQPLDVGHLERFKRMFRSNVPDHWDNKRRPYIPNGHSTLNNSTCGGGNWNTEEFSRDFEVMAIPSSGKVRVITLYSEFNVRTLTPLHGSLFHRIKKKGWLLVGPPNPSRLDTLDKVNLGRDWLSFDYIGATDNIKVTYIKACIEILKEKAQCLSEDEIACLDVLSALSIDGVDAESGQPMGSPMSFPLLCLINKTIVDLALTDQLLRKEIQFREWSRHRVLINGDDLLTKDTSSGGLARDVATNGSLVGMITNDEKTLTSPEYAEINSTVFKNCVLQKKTNVSSLWMKEENVDCLGCADESSLTLTGFRYIVRNNYKRLARAPKKLPRNIPRGKKAVCLTDPKIVKALNSSSSAKQYDTNLFGVETMSDGFDLSRSEQDAAIMREVARIKEERLWLTSRALNINNKKLRKSAMIVWGDEDAESAIHHLTYERPTRERTVLSVIARAWEKKRKDHLLADDMLIESPGPIISDLSGIDSLIDAIKAWRQPRTGVRTKTPPTHVVDAFSNGACFVSLADAD